MDEVVRLIVGFLSDFFANLFSDLIVGVILGSILAWWIGKNLSSYEQKQQRKEQRKIELERATQYLEILNDDIQHTYPLLEQWIQLLKENREEEKIYAPITDGIIPLVEYRLWNTIQHSGEIPNLLRPSIVRSLTLYYGSLYDARQSMEWLLSGWKTGTSHSASMSRVRKFSKLTLVGFESAWRYGEGLIEEIEKEIQSLHMKLAELH